MRPTFYRISVAATIEKYFGIYVKSPMFLRDYNQI